MLCVAESIYEGTWSSGPVPAEVQDYELMREMRWSWAELQATPLYVRRYSWDFTLARRTAENAAAERSGSGRAA